MAERLAPWGMLAMAAFGMATGFYLLVFSWRRPRRRRAAFRLRHLFVSRPLDEWSNTELRLIGVLELLTGALFLLLSLGMLGAYGPRS